MTVTSTLDRTAATATSTSRWGYLAICVVCMIAIANLQYGWTLFVNPMIKAQGWPIASIQFAFTLFIALETWLTPIGGWIVDVLGPRRGPRAFLGRRSEAHRNGIHAALGRANPRRGRIIGLDGRPACLHRLSVRGILLPSPLRQIRFCSLSTTLSRFPVI